MIGIIWRIRRETFADFCYLKSLTKIWVISDNVKFFSQFKDINQNGFSKRKRKRILLIVLLIVLINIFGKNKHLINMQFWYKIYITEVCYTSKSFKNFNCLKTELKTTITICYLCNNLLYADRSPAYGCRKLSRNCVTDIAEASISPAF